MHYGYKNHVKADAQSKLIERYAVTDASVHDSQKLAELVETTDGTVYADSVYRSAEAEAMLAQKQVASPAPAPQEKAGQSPGARVIRADANGIVHQATSVRT